jgi:hypothetical protein
VTVFFGAARPRSIGSRQRKIDRLMPIVVETEQIPNRRNSLSIQERDFLTDRGDGSSLRVKKIARTIQRVIMAQNNRVGVRGRVGKSYLRPSTQYSR